MGVNCPQQEKNSRKKSYVNKLTMSITLDDEDALFDSGSFEILHNEQRYFVDPTIFFNFSRKFAAIFQYVTKNPLNDPETGKKKNQFAVVSDNYEENAFGAYVSCCQMKPIAPSGSVLVDLLLIAEDWDSPRLIERIENLLSNRVPPNELIRLFSAVLKKNMSSEKIEEIITNNLPRFLDAPLFSSLPFQVIGRIIDNYKGKLTPAQLIKACYAASAQGGMDAIRFIKRYSFDNMKIDQINDLNDTFNKCPFRQLREFFMGMGSIVEQLTIPINKHKEFKKEWKLADKGDANHSYAFYKKVQEKNNTGRQSATELIFLKTAADRGHPRAQLDYGKWLLDRAGTEIKEDRAVEYLVQAAAKGIDGAIELLQPHFNLDRIDKEMHGFVYQNLAQQIIILLMNKDNFDSSKQSIMSLGFGYDDMKIQLLAQYILRAVQIRQRSQDVYAQLIAYLSQEAGFEKLKQNIFSMIIMSLFDKNPHRIQFIYLKFLYQCQQMGVFLQAEIEGPLTDFVRANAHIFVKTSLMIYYWFAPIIEKLSPDVSSFIFMKALLIEKGDFGVFDDHMFRFKDVIRAQKDAKMQDFDSMRSKEFYNIPLLHALVYDDLKSLKRIAENPDFNIDSKVPNWIVDLAFPDPNNRWDYEFSLIQFAAMQGSRSCFLYLLRRGAEYMEFDDELSSTCAAIGQDKFILGFITDVKQEIREEMFRMSGKFNNIHLMLLLLQDTLNVNCNDSKGSTALHFATRNQNNGIVNLLCHVEGINVNAANEDLVTPFHLAVFGGRLSTAEILAKINGIDVNCADKHGSTPLHYAVWNNDIVLVKFLLGLQDIDVNARAKLQRTPLHEAAKCGFLDIVRLLVKRDDIDLNPQDENRKTPIQLASQKSRARTDVVQFLNTIAGVDKPISTRSDSSFASETERQTTDIVHSGY